MSESQASNLSGECGCRPLVKFYLYETRARLYLVGHTKKQDEWRILKIDRTEARDLVLHEDTTIYTKNECDKILQQISAGNSACGGLHFVSKAFGILGFAKFLEGYYMVIITKRSKLGYIHKHAVYTVEETRHLPITHHDDIVRSSDPKMEERYLRIFRSMDLSKGFFFSYTYNLESTFQCNRLRKDNFEDKRKASFNSIFVWNSFLTEQLRVQVPNPFLWAIPVIHGYFEQNFLSVFGKVIAVTLIARRSRHFAGTRYLKRGVNDFGHVANDVETEQIVDAGSDWDYSPLRVSSFVQVRGSIPLFWSQDPNKLTAKPDIILRKLDPTYRATRLHFLHLMQRYGCPTIVLNLIKSKEAKPRETVLKNEYSNAIDYLNERIRDPSRKIHYIHWDFQKYMHDKSTSVLEALADVLSGCIHKTGFYFSTRASKQEPSIASPSDAKPKNSSVLSEMMQSGVIRTNCIDCLDRTNVAQFIAGYIALGRQFQALRLMNSDMLDAESDVSFALMKMYESMGDTLAIQYGGSEAHRAFFKNQRGHWSAATKSAEFLTSIRRFYSNKYTDSDKQEAINLFLGYYTPDIDRQPLWELDSDYYLHVGQCIVDRGFDANFGEEEDDSTKSSLVTHQFPERGIIENYKGKYESFDKLLNKGHVRVRLHKDGLKLIPHSAEQAFDEERPSFSGLQDMKKKLVGQDDVAQILPTSPDRPTQPNYHVWGPSSSERDSTNSSDDELNSEELARVYKEADLTGTIAKVDQFDTALQELRECLVPKISNSDAEEYRRMFQETSSQKLVALDSDLRAQYCQLLSPEPQQAL